MSTINSELLSKLEALLSDTYVLIQRSQGDIDTPGSVVSIVEQAKSLLKGGYRSNFGIMPINSLNTEDKSGIITKTGTERAWSIPTTRLIFGGQERWLNYTLVTGPLTDANNNTVGANQYMYCLVAAKDTTTGPDFKKKADIVYYKTYNLGGLTLPKAALPECKEGEVPLRYICFEGRGNENQIYVTLINTPYDNAYYESPGNDDIVSVFKKSYNLKSSQVNKNRSSELKELLDGLSTHVKNTTGLTFKDYWKSQNYEFDSNFLSLWAASQKEQLSVKLGEIKPNSEGDSTFTDAILDIPSRVEAKLSTGATVAGSIALSIISSNYKKGRITHINKIGWKDVEVQGAGDWPSAGTVWFKTGDYTSDEDRNVATYTKPDADKPERLLLDDGLTKEIPAWSDAYYVESATINVAAGSPAGAILYPTTQQVICQGIAGGEVVTTDATAIIRSR